MSRALIFDCDGVLADTEKDGHLPAFNEMFRAMGLPVHWSSEEYHRLLSIGGGKERLATLFTNDLAVRANLPMAVNERSELLAAWHKDKTERYADRIRSGAIPGRPGVVRLVQQAVGGGWQLAVASTSAEKSVRAVLEHVVGFDLAERFQIFAGDIVPRKKPAPDIYLLALREMGVRNADAVVIEDSAVGLQAALSAGLTTVITTSSYTAEDDFTGASLVVSSLGAPPSEPARTLMDPHGLAVEGKVELAHLAQLLSGQP
jgi:HAD superfamily hydrolase (TIGR01509 family)